MSKRIVILGAGFGGLELATMLSEACGDDVDVTLIDKNDAFIFGFSKLSMMFEGASRESVSLPYTEIKKPGVRFAQEKITAIDPEAKRVTTDAGEHEADILVVALGADYDFAATPGLVRGENEFYTFEGAANYTDRLAEFDGGDAVIGVCDAPFKCPPAPSEVALLLHDHLTMRGIRDNSTITFTIPLSSPVPPSPETSEALLEAFAERDIKFVPNCRIKAIDTERSIVDVDNGSHLPCDLFFGVPKHRAPDVVLESGMSEDGYIPVSPKNLATKFPGVYAIGDVTTVGAPKAGVFAEGAGRVAAKSIIAELRGEQPPAPYDGRGICYIEFGADRVGRVEVDFLSGPKPTGNFGEPSPEVAADKERFAKERHARWFGR